MTPNLKNIAHSIMKFSWAGVEVRIKSIEMRCDLKWSFFNTSFLFEILIFIFSGLN